MRIRHAIGVAALSLMGAASLAQPVLADGMPAGRARPVYGAPVYEPYNFGGIYFGGHRGGGHIATEWAVSALDRIDESSTSFAGGGQVGAQMQWGNAVLGFEVSYTWINAEESGATPVAVGTLFSSDVSNLFTATGRLGYANDNMLAYAKGGYASGDVGFRAAVPATGLVASSSEREHGWVAGVGLEYGLTRHITIGAEYTFVHLNAGGSTLAGALIGDGDVDIQTVTARLNFRFGGRAEAVPYK
jgi:outer membrane immunogenic protein